MNRNASPSNRRRQFPWNGVAHIRKTTKSTLVIVLQKSSFKMNFLIVKYTLLNWQYQLLRSKFCKKIEFLFTSTCLTYFASKSGFLQRHPVVSYNVVFRVMIIAQNLPKQLEDQMTLEEFRILRYFVSELQIRLRQTEM